MSKSLAVLAIGFIAATASAGWFWHELAAEREHSNWLAARVDDLEHSLKEAAVRPPQVVMNTAAAAASPVVPTTAPVNVAAVAPAAANVAVVSRPMPGQSQLLANPEYNSALRAQRRVELARQWNDLASTLHISQEQADKLIDLKIDFDLRRSKMAEDFATNQTDTNERMRQFNDAQSGYDAAVAKLLGNDQATEFATYQQNLPYRNQVHQLQGAFATNGIEPLRDDQFNPMVNVFSANQQQLQKEMADYTSTLPWTDDTRQQSTQLRNQKFIEEFTAYTHRMHDAAAAVLSPQQMQRFDLIMQRQMTTQRARMQMANVTNNVSDSSPPN